MSVKKHDNGRWYYKFQLDGIPYHRACKGATDYKSARKCEIEALDAICSGNSKYNKKSKTFEDAVNIFLKHSQTSKLSYKTDLSRLMNVTEFFNKNCSLKSITPSKINDFKTFLKYRKVKQKIKLNNPEYKKNGCRKKYIYKCVEVEKERSNATINRHIELISKMFSLCIAEGYIDKNPCTFVQRLRTDNYKIRYLTEDEEKRFFELSEEYFPNLNYIYLFAIHTGMRRSEIFNLKWNQIDFKSREIDVLKTKSGKPRKVPISDDLLPILIELNQKQVNGYVLPNPKTGKPYVSIYRSFKTIVKKANIENFRFHDFRHTVATRLVSNGFDLLLVQDILGHDEIKTTMRYAHPVKENKLAAINSLCKSNKTNSD